MFERQVRVRTVCSTQVIAMAVVGRLGAQVPLDRVWTSTATTFTPVLAHAQGPNDRVAITRVESGSNLRTVRLDLNESSRGHCAPQTNSPRCTPQRVSSGGASASVASGWAASVSMARQTNARTCFSTQRMARTPRRSRVITLPAAADATHPLAESSRNAAPAENCSGVLRIDMNAFASGKLGGRSASGVSVPGTRV